VAWRSIAAIGSKVWSEAQDGALRLVGGLRGNRRRRSVLVIGDSHVRVFESPRFPLALPGTRFEVVHAKGGSAIGILNPRSTSGARALFDAALARGGWDAVVVCLGEVDTAYTLWRQAEFHRVPVTRMFERSITAYLTFLDGIRAHHRLVVLAAPYPTLGDIAETADPVLAMRALVTVGQRERTDLALEFNRRVGVWCAAQGVPLLDTAEAALGADRLVRADWTVRRRPDHHYARAPFARWLVRALPPVLDAVADRPLET
jgi:hypothetical protein